MTTLSSEELKKHIGGRSSRVSYQDFSQIFVSSIRYIDASHESIQNSCSRYFSKSKLKFFWISIIFFAWQFPCWQSANGRMLPPLRRVLSLSFLHKCLSFFFNLQISPFFLEGIFYNIYIYIYICFNWFIIKKNNNKKKYPTQDGGQTFLYCFFIVMYRWAQNRHNKQSNQRICSENFHNCVHHITLGNFYQQIFFVTKEWRKIY